MSKSDTPRPKADGRETEPQWLLLAYRVPSEPSSNRISIWRDLKRLGAYYPQQAVCILPGRPEIIEQLADIRSRVETMEGTSTYLEIPWLAEDQHDDLVRTFRDLAAKEYAEIVEECQTKFVKEIEFERFRKNYTFEEVEEIRQDLHKIRRWFAAVEARDWFDSASHGEAQDWLKECAVLLDAFEADVFEHTKGTDHYEA